MARTKERSRKRKSSEYAAEDGFMNDSDGFDSRPTKRTKSQSTQLQRQTDKDGNAFWEISKMRRVTVSEFKGKQMISVREYYEQNGEIKPGKKVWKRIRAIALAGGWFFAKSGWPKTNLPKGISMPLDQYSAFIELLPQIEKELGKNGETVPRPQYEGQLSIERGTQKEDESDVDEGNSMQKKSNIEATSDEDEG
jgi:hypothetical protein